MQKLLRNVIPIEIIKKYRESSHKFELKQRLYFLLQQSKSFDDFLEKAKQLHVQIDFSQKHSRFFDDR